MLKAPTLSAPQQAALAQYGGTMTEIVAPEPDRPSDHSLMTLMAQGLTTFGDALFQHYAMLLSEEHAGMETLQHIYRKEGKYGYRITLRSTNVPGVVSIDARCGSAPALGYLLEYIEREYTDANMRAHREHTLRGTFLIIAGDIPCLNPVQ